MAVGNATRKRVRALPRGSGAREGAGSLRKLNARPADSGMEKGTAGVRMRKRHGVSVLMGGRAKNRSRST